MIQPVSIPECLPRRRLVDLLERVSRLRLGVLGDFILDGYWQADMSRARLSREAPLFPRPVVKEAYSCGGAANVAWNLASLGLSEVRAFTLLGQDWRGEILGAALREIGVEQGSILRPPGWRTPFFGKIILNAGELHQEDSRVDFINPAPPPPAALAALLAELESRLAELDGLVVADYLADGVVSGILPAALSALAGRQPGKLWAADSREQAGNFKGFVLKPNDLEAACLLLPGRGSPDPDAKDLPLQGGPAEHTLEELARAGLTFQEEGRRPFFITLGVRGCLVLAEGAALHLPAVQSPGAVDPVGAGDSFLAALAAGLAAGASALEAGCLANLAAGVTVRKLHITGTASPAEILQIYDKVGV